MALTVSASGVGGATGGGARIDTPPGTITTIESGTVSDTRGLDLGGELRLAGELHLSDQTADQTLTYTASGNGRGLASGTAAVFVSRLTISGYGYGRGFGRGSAISSRNILAASSGVAIGSATARTHRIIAASGIGVGVGPVGVIDSATPESGTVETIGSGVVGKSPTSELAGQLNLAGELQLAEAENVATRTYPAAGDGTGTAAGTGLTARERLLVAVGDGTGTGTGDAVEAIPLTRTSSATVTFDVDEEFTLTTDE